MDYTLLIFGEAERIFGDKATAAAWLSQHRQVFEGHSALAMAVDQDGVDRVLEILRRLEHGFCTGDVCPSSNGLQGVHAV